MQRWRDVRSIPVVLVVSDGEVEPFDRRYSVVRVDVASHSSVVGRQNRHVAGGTGYGGSRCSHPKPVCAWVLTKEVGEIRYNFQ